MSRREKRVALWMALAIAGALSVPYLLAWGVTPPERAYMGHIWNPDEPNVYYAWTRQAADGRVLLQDLFTTDPQDGRFTNVFFVGLGWIAALTRLPIPWVYAIARFACAATLFYALYQFAAAMGGSRLVRRATVLLGATASGLGWLAVALAPVVGSPLGAVQCVDVGLAVGRRGGVSEGLMMPETNTFASALLLPLFSISMALLLWLIPLASKAFERGDVRRGAKAGLLGLALGGIHTYDMIPVHLILLALAALLAARRALGWRQVAAYAAFGVVSLPSMLYQVYVFTNDAVFREKASTVTASPSPLSYAVSFGVPLLLAVCGLAFVARRREWRWAPCAVWLVVGLAVAFLPGLSFQRKMIEGVHLPMVALAAVFLVRLLPWFGPSASAASYARRAWRLACVAAVLCLPSSAYFLVGRSLASVTENNLSRVGAMMPPYSLSRDDLAAARWLRENAEPEAGVLSGPHLGSYLPGLTGRKVYIGHWAETLDFEEKLRNVAAAYGGEAGPRSEAVLRSCRYVVSGEYERLFGPPEALQSAGGEGLALSEVHRSGGTTVYRVDARAKD